MGNEIPIYSKHAPLHKLLVGVIKTDQLMEPLCGSPIKILTTKKMNTTELNGTKMCSCLPIRSDYLFILLRGNKKPNL